jgi:hypothetical protein
MKDVGTCNLLANVSKWLGFEVWVFLHEEFFYHKLQNVDFEKNIGCNCLLGWF